MKGKKKMYYKVTITKTGKSIGSKEDYSRFDTEVKTFETKDLALAWIDAEYQGHKKVKMYQDREDGAAEHCGWIYCFIVEKWTQQDWVTLTEVTELTLTW